MKKKTTGDSLCLRLRRVGNGREDEITAMEIKKRRRDAMAIFNARKRFYASRCAQRTLFPPSLRSCRFSSFTVFPSLPPRARLFYFTARVGFAMRNQRSESKRSYEGCSIMTETRAINRLFYKIIHLPTDHVQDTPLLKRYTVSSVAATQ